MRHRLSLVAAVALLASASWAAGTGAWTHPSKYRFEYRVALSKLAVANDATLRLWLPYPPETGHQKVLAARIDSPWRYQENEDFLGNRSVYIEGKGVPDRDLTMTFEVERWPSDGVRPAAIAAGTPLDPQRYLHADKLVPLDGLIRQIADQQSKGHDSDREKVRAFYDYVVKNMRYNKDGTGWGRGDAIWACNNKRGNCTDFHSLFIGMARSESIPARFLIGFPIPDTAEGTIAGYHCWAEYFDKQRGWVPVDASEANKAGNPDAYFGTLPNDRIEFGAGRDLTLVPKQDGPPLNYFIYPYAEADGKPLEKVPASFRFERLPARSARR